LHITVYRSANGPGIELLEYLVPGPGKKYPADTRADDHRYWQTTLFTDDAEALYNKLQSQGYQFVSRGLVKISPKQGKGFIVKDPDGHAMFVTEALKH
jgi:hypothetical protein